MRKCSFDGCREEVLAAAKAIHDAGHSDFSPAKIILRLKQAGTKFEESTIRTQVTSRMCAQAPDNHGTTYDDLERIGHGKYRLKT
jgi:hypothetical protein